MPHLLKYATFHDRSFQCGFHGKTDLQITPQTAAQTFKHVK